MLLVGDAAGYVEPFTGEGIAWASGGAVAAAPLVEAGVRAWSPELEREWARRHRAVVGSRQRLCRAAAWSLRRPLVRRAALRAGRAAPVLVRAVAGRLHHPYNLGGAAGSATAACLNTAPS
jgi:flavin-dependent dehydrogenase